jgi:hypothetical protein
VVDVEYKHFGFLTVPDLRTETESFGSVNENVAYTFSGDGYEDLGGTGFVVIVA